MQIHLKSCVYLILWRVFGSFGTDFRRLGRAKWLDTLCLGMCFMMEMKNWYAVVIEDTLMNLQRSTECDMFCDVNVQILGQCIFKEGIEPKYEDPQNMKGGNMRVVFGSICTHLDEYVDEDKKIS